MFELNNDSEKKNSFYAEFPHLEKIDEELKALPGLLSPDALFYDPEYFEEADRYGQQLNELIPLISAQTVRKPTGVSIAEIQHEIIKKGKAKGAKTIGFTKLHEQHFYSTKGRGERYGETIKSAHRFAVAITVEMDKNAVGQAPFAPVIAESTKQYLRSAQVAVEVAKYIREMGFEATAHIDGNYEVICPLLARDAGLGDIGRMGLLMTPQLGPRVRIAVVTTNLELKPSKKKYNSSVQYFCRICKKCAHACPSQAIPSNILIVEGTVRYKINHEKCYGYWAKTGTDCARCMSVCPYSHSNNLFHNVIRFGIKQNPIFARFALYADHFFYGRIPKLKGRKQT